MFSWMNGKKSKPVEEIKSVQDELKKLYKQRLLPLEKEYMFHDFHNPALDEPDFHAIPMVLLIGQYSTGKTTFIRYLLEQDFPGIRIGPEPTTDGFIVVMHHEHETTIPGNALVVDKSKQFGPLSRFGNAFLNKFQCSQIPNEVLESITIVDTPGILSGEKQRVDRGYEFSEVIEWFAERVDRIILLFDAHKLDISDEFRRVIESMKGHDEKIRIVLNKADMVDHQQLMRVYGALMWSLGKVLNTPEVVRVYLGSFWDKVLQHDTNRRLFELEEQDLFHDIQSLPRNSAVRKLNDFIKRARLAKVHAYIIAHLKSQMPSLMGKENKKKELIRDLAQTYAHLQREHQISPGDFPDLKRMQENLQHHDFSKFQLLKPKIVQTVDSMLSTDIARLMQLIPSEEAQISQEPSVKGGAFDGVSESPFGVGVGEGCDKGRGEDQWVVAQNAYKYEEIFQELNPIDGKVSGANAKKHLVKSGLPNSTLGKIWKLSDIDKDGQLDLDEFGLATHLVQVKLDGHDLPVELPSHLVPPAKRGVS